MKKTRIVALMFALLVVLNTSSILGRASNFSQNDNPPVLFKELDSFQRDGENDVWRNVVVSPVITRDQLIALGKYLYEKYPRTRINIFDDDTQFKAFMNWRLHFYKPDKPNYPMPQKWMNEHYLAMINRMADPPFLSWELRTADGGNRFTVDGEAKLIVFEKLKNPLLGR